MDETPRHIGAALLQDLSDKLAVLAHDLLGVDQDKAENFAKEITIRVAFDWGGQNLYIPYDLAGRLLSRNQVMYSEFTGGNASELAQKYGISVQQVHRIIKAMRAERTTKQYSLFA